MAVDRARGRAGHVRWGVVDAPVALLDPGQVA